MEATTSSRQTPSPVTARLQGAGSVVTLARGLGAGPGHREENMAKRAVLIVETGPAEGRDEDWNSWYDGVHIPEILEKVPGFHAATRFERPPGTDIGPEEQGYCTVYEIEAEDPAASVAALGSGMQSGALTRSDSSAGRAKLTLWVEKTPRASKS